MPSLPRKSVKGTIFKKWVVDSIDQIIDYLSSNWLQPGNGINIRRTPSGTIVELQKVNTAPQSSGGGGGSVVATGFPNYANVITNVAVNTPYVYNYPVWVIGTIEATDNEGLTVTIGTQTFNLFEFVPTYISQATYKVFVSFPVPTGTTFSFTQIGGSVYAGLRIFSCT